jgi:hypothetical protein
VSIYLIICKKIPRKERNISTPDHVNSNASPVRLQPYPTGDDGTSKMGMVARNNQQYNRYKQLYSMGLIQILYRVYKMKTEPRYEFALNFAKQPLVSTF